MLSASIDGYARADYGARSATDDSWVVFNLDKAEHITDLTLHSTGGTDQSADTSSVRTASQTEAPLFPRCAGCQSAAAIGSSQVESTKVDKTGGYHLDVLPGDHRGGHVP